MSSESEIELEFEDEVKHKNVFLQPWNDSDLVLTLGDKKFHVHRCILSLQSEVFKTMFNGDFQEAKQGQIELHDDDHEAMLFFLKLLYPPNMLAEDESEVKISDENVMKIVKLADKYIAINVIKQCIQKLERLTPTNIMCLLPYAVRRELPLEKILNAISRQVSIKELEKFAPELDNDCIYKQCLVKKICYLEKRYPRWKS